MYSNFLPILRYSFLIICILVTGRASSQGFSYFDIVPDLDGKYVQGKALIVLPDTHEIFVMGDIIDTTVKQGTQVVRPFLAGFDYDGSLIRLHLIYDTITQSKYSLFTRPMIRKDSSILVYIDRINEEGYKNPNLLEIDLRTGNHVNSKDYPLPDNLDKGYRGEWYYQDTYKNIVSYHFLGQSDRILIRVIDSLFNLKSSTVVNPNNRINGPKYIEADSDTSFLLIGTSISPSGEGYRESKPFLMRVNHEGEILNFKFAPGILHEIVSFTALNSYTVLKDANENWIMSVVYIDEENCTICPKLIPFSFCVNNTFDSLLWINYFSGIPADSNQYYTLTGSDLSTDGTGFVVSGYNYTLPERNSFLTKISMEGESLWTRNFIHINWEQERIAWADVEDVKSTPHNTYALVGMVYDKHDMIRVPWVLHLDSMGCLIAGCDRVVSTNEGIDLKKEFIIYPNPASDYLYINYLGNNKLSLPCQISIISMRGEIVKTAYVNAQNGDQYFSSIQNLPPGQYVITIHDSNGLYKQSEQIIKL